MPDQEAVPRFTESLLREVRANLVDVSGAPPEMTMVRDRCVALIDALLHERAARDEMAREMEGVIGLFGEPDGYGFLNSGPTREHHLADVHELLAKWRADRGGRE